MSLTTDRDDPRLTYGIDTEPGDQAEMYLVISDEEKAKGFVRPVRRSYVHVGVPPPAYPLRDLTTEERERYEKFEYEKFEAYPKDGCHVHGRFWTRERLDKVGRGCGTVTTMAEAIAETYARDPKFYGATYCCGCRMHLPVEEFIWDGTDERVGS